MKLVSLRIESLPGIEPGFTFDGLSPAVTVVTGPNAIGKSSLVRALGYLFGEPGSKDPVDLVLQAEFEEGEDRLRVRRVGTDLRWEKNGEPCERPPLPDPDQLHCYLLSMEDLQDTGPDDRLMTELRRALAGGYDLEACRAGFPDKPKAGQTESKRLQKALALRREVELENEGLLREEARLDSLERDLTRASDLAAEAGRLGQAIELIQTQEQLDQLQAELSQLPPEMERLTGKERDRLETLEGLIESLGRDIAAVSDRYQSALAERSRTGLSDELPAVVDLEARAKELEEARRKIDRIEERRRSLHQARAAEEHARRSLGGEGGVPRLDPPAIEKAEIAAAALHAADCRYRELSAKAADAPEPPDQAEIDAHQRAASALRDWLAADAGPSTVVWIALVAACAGALLAGLVAYIGDNWLAAAGALFALFALVVAWKELRSSGARATAERAFERGGLALPEGWSKPRAEARLLEIEAAIAALQRDQQRAGAAEELRKDLASASDELEARKRAVEELAGELGFDPAPTAVSFERFVRLVGDHDEARAEREGLESELTLGQAEVEARISRLGEFLARWGASPEQLTIESVEVGLTALRRRLESAEAADRAILDARASRERLFGQLQQREEEVAALYAGAGLEPGARDELLRRLGRLGEWKDLRSRAMESEVVVRDRTGALEGYPDLLEQVRRGAGDEIADRLSLAKEAAERAEELRNEIADIRGRLKSAGRGSRLEQATAGVAAAQAALSSALDDALEGEAGRFLLDQVEEEFKRTHEPALLRDAKARFLSFTHHAFELDLDPKGVFFARDLRQDKVRSLKELSSATRMQLLLSARMAWAKKLEEGRLPLPLFLDEALTTTDEHRFKVIAGSLEELAHTESRQVFYLAARGHEPALWERSTGTRPHHVDLAIVRSVATGSAPEDFSLPPATSLPDPEGHTPESYAASLGLPPLSPRQPEGTIHVFHLLRDDLPLLHRFMQSRVVSLGALERLLETDAGAVFIPEPENRGLTRDRAAAARIWVCAWRRGRGKPVDGAMLARSGIVSERFLDQVATLADELGGDAEALIQALGQKGVRGFGAKKVNDLEEWLTEEGAISHEEPLAEDERLHAVLARMGSRMEPERIGEIVRWLEAGLGKRADRELPEEAPAQGWLTNLDMG